MDSTSVKQGAKAAAKTAGGLAAKGAELGSKALKQVAPQLNELKDKAIKKANLNPEQAKEAEGVAKAVGVLGAGAASMAPAVIAAGVVGAASYVVAKEKAPEKLEQATSIVKEKSSQAMGVANEMRKEFADGYKAKKETTAP